MTEAVRTEALTKYYGPVVGLEHLDLRVEAGEVYGFLGPNGAGKTTTIRLLLDLLRPTSGRAQVLGLDVRRDSRTVRGQTGYLPAEMPVYREMRGSAFLSFLGSLEPRRVDAAWWRRLLTRFAVSDVDLRRRLGDLSHGMRRKIGILQALAGRPRLLVLDEPTAGLDPLMIEAFAETMAELKRDGQTTVFLSSHVLSEVERLCDRIGIIRRGTLARETSLNELRRDMPRRVRVTFAGPAPAVPARLAPVLRAGPRQWDIQWRGPIGDLVASLDGSGIADIEIEPFRLEEYVLGVYSEES